MPNAINYALPSIPEIDYDLVQHYMKHVVKMQYLLVNESTKGLIFATMQQSTSARAAACLLSSLHRNLRSNAVANDTDSENQISAVRRNLTGKVQLSEGDAMAGLHIVSFILFRGGRGQWKESLQIACRYADGVLFRPEYLGPQDALMRCSPTTGFIIKTTMWFDVLASATQVEVPHFLQVFRDLFDPNRAFIDGSPSSVPEELSMLSIMGCENHIVWALAEISNLACWKDHQRQKGALSMPELLKRGAMIEPHLMPPTSTPIFYQDIEQTRFLTSQIFRASARVYLHSVLSGDYPSCKEIAEGVADTIYWLKQVLELSTRSVMRSVVFSICICGCLTDIQWQRDYLLECLETQHDAVGNCREVKALIQKVWNSRLSSNYESVTWRDVMRQTQMLLV